MKIILELENGKESYVSLIGRFDDGKEEVSVLVVETFSDRSNLIYALEADDAEVGSVDHTFMKQLVEGIEGKPDNYIEWCEGIIKPRGNRRDN